MTDDGSVVMTTATISGTKAMVTHDAAIVSMATFAKYVVVNLNT